MLKENLDLIFNTIKGGNNLGESITLVGATKMVDADTINKSIELGVGCVAENHVQEFVEKYPFIHGAEQHFIGHLQTNKVKYLVGKVQLIHSCDSLHLAKEISKQAVKKCVCQNVLIQINVANEITKGGLAYDDAISQIKDINQLPNLKILGLMAMLPHSDDTLYLKNLCLQMRKLFDILKLEGYDMKYLSVGMSSDYQIAIANGSNMIRLGSCIYGKRNYGEISK